MMLYDLKVRREIERIKVDATKRREEYYAGLRAISNFLFRQICPHMTLHSS
jgi:hypothetical protein